MFWMVQNGGKLGRKVGYRKPKEDKEKQYAEVFRYIRKGYGVRTTSKITHVSESTIHRLKREFDMQAA